MSTARIPDESMCECGHPALNHVNFGRAECDAGCECGEFKDVIPDAERIAALQQALEEAKLDAAYVNCKLTVDAQKEVIDRLQQDRDKWKGRAEELEGVNTRLIDSLKLVYDKWENGVQTFEADGGVIDESSSPVGNAFNLDFAEEQEILNLIVEKAESFEQECANCGKPYRAHLLHDGNKCAPGKPNGWFPKSIADALLTPAKEPEKEEHGN